MFKFTIKRSTEKALIDVVACISVGCTIAFAGVAGTFAYAEADIPTPIAIGFLVSAAASAITLYALGSPRVIGTRKRGIPDHRY